MNPISTKSARTSFGRHRRAFRGWDKEPLGPDFVLISVKRRSRTKRENANRYELLLFTLFPMLTGNTIQTFREQIETVFSSPSPANAPM